MRADTRLDPLATGGELQSPMAQSWEASGQPGFVPCFRNKLMSQHPNPHLALPSLEAVRWLASTKPGRLAAPIPDFTRTSSPPGRRRSGLGGVQRVPRSAERRTPLTPAPNHRVTQRGAATESMRHPEGTRADWRFLGPAAPRCDGAQRPWRPHRHRRAARTGRGLMATKGHNE